MCKKIKKGLICFFILMLTICNVHYSNAENKAIINATNSVVRILVEDKNGNFYQTTGFAIGEKGKSVNTFITQGSVIKDSKSIKIIVDYYGGSYVDASSITVLSNPDIALLSVSSPVDKWKPLLLTSAQKITKSTPVYQLGFSENEDKVRKDSKLKSSPSDVVITGAVVSKEKTSINNINYIQVENDQKYGYYGGPLLDEKGNVVGINAFNSQNSSSIAIHSDYLFDILDSKSIAYSKAQDNLMLYIAGGAVAFIVLILIIVLVSSKKKQRPNPALDNDNSRTVAMFEQNPQPQPQQNMNIQSSDNYPRVIGVSGYFTSKEFKISDMVTVGRDPKRTKITFPDKTKGVSAVHMEIRNVSGRIEIVDVGSTYGTFLNGRKLDKMVPYIASKGDSFYLGDKDNKFQVL